MQSENRDDVHTGKIFAVISYWLFLCILPLLLKKNNSFAVFHAKQGLVLFVFLVLGFILNMVPFLGWLIYRVVLFLYLVMLVWGSSQALLGKYTRIPVVSRIADKIIL